MEWRQYDNLSDDIKNALFKITLAPFIRKINSAKSVNCRGVLPKRIVICGSPRSGTTLMNEFMKCFYGTYVMNREEYALRFPYLVVNKKYIVTKHPLDFSNIDKIIDVYNDPYILFMLRDPRDVIVSKHFKYKDQYFVNFTLWEKAIHAFESTDYDKKLLVKYEELIRKPNVYQKEIARQINLESKSNFEDYYQFVDKRHQDVKALGGVRNVDPGNFGKFKAKENYNRIKTQLNNYPQMSDYLIKYGYEKNKEWEEEYR